MTMTDDCLDAIIQDTPQNTTDDKIHPWRICPIGRSPNIEDYPSDQPYPSCFRLGFVKNRPLHVVTAQATEEGIIVIITVYEPDPTRWEPGFEKRKQV